MKKLSLKTVNVAVLIAAGMILSSNVSAGVCASGLFADIYCIATGDVAGANMADKAWDGFKRSNPVYGQWEDQYTNDVRSNMGLEPHCQDAYNKYDQYLGCF